MMQKLGVWMVPLLAVAAVGLGAIGVGVMGFALSFGAEPNNDLGVMVPTTVLGNVLTVVAGFLVMIGSMGVMGLLLIPSLALLYGLMRVVSWGSGAPLRRG